MQPETPNLFNARPCHMDTPLRRVFKRSDTNVIWSIISDTQKKGKGAQA